MEEQKGDAETARGMGSGGRASDGSTISTICGLCIPPALPYTPNAVGAGAHFVRRRPAPRRIGSFLIY